MSEDIEAVFNNGCPPLTDNWLEELKRHTTVLLVDLPPVPSAPLFGGLYAASKVHEEMKKHPNSTPITAACVTNC